MQVRSLTRTGSSRRRWTVDETGLAVCEHTAHLIKAGLRKVGRHARCREAWLSEECRVFSLDVLSVWIGWLGRHFWP